jgi:putative FmdB family regulatory protein
VLRAVVTFQTGVMPIYEYNCTNCGVFEEMRKVSDPLIKRCPKCKGKVERIVSRTSFVLKGSGWYATDYARKPATSSDSASSSTDTSASTNGTSSTASTSDSAAKSDSASKSDSPAKADASAAKSAATKSAAAKPTD